MVSWCLELCHVTVCFPFIRAVLETSPTVFESPLGPSQGFMGCGQEVKSHRVTAYQDGHSREGGRVLRVGLGEPGSRGSCAEVSGDSRTENKTWGGFWAVYVGAGI